MKRILFGTMVLALVMVAPIPTMAAVDIHIGIPLPPAYRISSPATGDRDSRCGRCLCCSRCRCGHIFLEWLVVASMGGSLVSLTLL